MPFGDREYIWAQARWAIGERTEPAAAKDGVRSQTLGPCSGHGRAGSSAAPAGYGRCKRMRTTERITGTVGSAGTGRHRNDTGDGQPPGALFVMMLPVGLRRLRRPPRRAGRGRRLGPAWTRSTTGQLRINASPGLFSSPELGNKPTPARAPVATMHGIQLAGELVRR
jgi:hypothetical protein